MSGRDREWGGRHNRHAGAAHNRKRRKARRDRRQWRRALARRADAMPRLTARQVLDRQVLEEDFMQQVIDYARQRGWEAYHTRDSRRSREGFPDLTLVRPPRLVFAETKRELGQLTPEQRRCLLLLHLARQEVHVWRPSCLQQILEVLR